MKSFTCDEQIRLDVFLSKHLQLPRNQIINFIRKVGVKINHIHVNKSSYKLQQNDIVEVQFLDAKEQKNEYEIDFDVSILYEDEHILVVNKPPFLTIHQAPSVKEATLVDWLKSKNICLSTISGEQRYGIVHRIDKQTSGALVVAKTNKAHQNLSLQLQNKTMGRYYLAFVDNGLKQPLLIEKPIARNPKNRLKMAVVENGRYAKSAFYNLLTCDDGVSLIAAKLFTGRTHQIRVHLQSINRHILGDDLYGFKRQKVTIARVMLHAYLLYLQHPISKKILHVKAPFFDDFGDLLQKYFLRNENDEIFKSEYILSRFDDVCSWVSKNA